MITPPRNLLPARGVTLIETVIAMGVLAVAIPLVFGALAESGKSGMSAEAETRSTWMIPACMEEIQASREGRPQFFTATTVGKTFPPASELWALAFSPEGAPLGKITQTEYDKGTPKVSGKAVRYLATLTSKVPTITTGATPMLDLRITLEYPATLPATKRQKLDFYSRIP